MGHDDVGVDTQAFVLAAVREAVGHDAAGRFGDENREPINYGIGDLVDGGFVANAVGFHGGIIRVSGMMCECWETLRSEEWRGHETAATAEVQIV